MNNVVGISAWTLHRFAITNMTLHMKNNITYINICTYITLSENFSFNIRKAKIFYIFITIYIFFEVIEENRLFFDLSTYTRP